MKVEYGRSADRVPYRGAGILAEIDAGMGHSTNQVRQWQHAHQINRLIFGHHEGACLK